MIILIIIDSNNEFENKPGFHLAEKWHKIKPERVAER